MTKLEPRLDPQLSKNKSDEQKVAMLLMIAGPAVIDVYNTLDFGEAAPGADRSQVLSVVLEKLDNYFAREEMKCTQGTCCDTESRRKMSPSTPFSRT
ncbi:hypothetical protein MTO96_004864 [Rhipicephalus appendiculatus]